MNNGMWLKSCIGIVYRVFWDGVKYVTMTRGGSTYRLTSKELIASIVALPEDQNLWQLQSRPADAERFKET